MNQFDLLVNDKTYTFVIHEDCVNIWEELKSKHSIYIGTINKDNEMTFLKGHNIPIEIKNICSRLCKNKAFF